MKKIAVLLLCLVLLLSGCAKSDAAPETTAAAETTEAVTEAPTEAETTEPEAPTETELVGEPVYTDVIPNYTYDDILFDYALALAESRPVEAYFEVNMCHLVGLVNDADKIGYCFADLNGDDYPELLIGAVGEPYIYAMYTQSEEGSTMLIDAGERNTYQVSGTGKIVNYGSSSAFLSAYRFLRFEDGQLIFEDALISDYNADEENPWFYMTEDSDDVSRGSPVSNEEADAIIAATTETVVCFEYTPFSEYAAG